MPENLKGMKNRKKNNCIIRKTYTDSNLIFAKWVLSLQRNNFFRKENFDQKQQYIQMKGRDIFKLATRAMAENSRMVLEKAHLQKSDLDWFIPHQANIRIIETASKFLEMDASKVIVTIEKYGNNSSATIPIAFHEAVTDGRIKRGQIVMLAAFGAGITSASLALKF